MTSTMNYTFDTVGRIASKSLSNGSTVQYTDAMLYDFRDRMTQQSRTQSSGGNLWSKFFYNSLDLVTTAQQGTGSVTSNPELVQTTTRDLAGRPTSISYQSGANSLATYSMAYVSASNRLASLTTPQGTTNYNYSANGQLIQAGSTGYTYDANGNPTNRAGKTTQIGTWNRLLDDGDFTYQYDAEGRTTVRTSKTTGQTESYVWNRRGQLTQIDVHSNANLTNLTGQVNYSYDPTGRRTSVRNQTGIGSGSYAQSVDYLMSDGDQVGQILGATGQTTRRFRYGIGVDSVLSEQRFSGGTASNPEYQLTDHLGTVRGVAQRTTGVNAAVVNTLQYDSFGKLISQSNASKQPYHGFAGRDIEPVGGLTYNRNRYYSTQTGRFISQDPIGFTAGDENLYRYVGNSPTNATDPTGLWQEDAIESVESKFQAELETDTFQIGIEVHQANQRSITGENQSGLRVTIRVLSTGVAGGSHASSGKFNFIARWEKSKLVQSTLKNGYVKPSGFFDSKGNLRNPLDYAVGEGKGRGFWPASTRPGGSLVVRNDGSIGPPPDSTLLNIEVKTLSKTNPETKIHSNAELLDHVKSMKPEIGETRVEQYRNAQVVRETEVAIEGAVSPKAIVGPKGMAVIKSVRVLGRGLLPVAVLSTAMDVGEAIVESKKTNSVKPLAVESVNQAAIWGTAIAFGKVGFLIGGYLGGPVGAAVGGLAGGLIGAYVGSKAGCYAKSKLQ